MREQWNESTAVAKGLYDPRFEHDNCGIGAVVNIKGIKTHQTVENALKIVENLKHRAGKGCGWKDWRRCWYSCSRFHINSLRRPVKPLGIDTWRRKRLWCGNVLLPTG